MGIDTSKRGKKFEHLTILEVDNHFGIINKELMIHVAYLSNGIYRAFCFKFD